MLADSDQTLITSAKVLNPFNLTQYKSDKESILVIKCETADDEMRDIYEAQQKAIRDRLSYIDEAERRGRKEGIKEGIKEGWDNSIANLLQSHAGTEEQIAAWLKLPLERVHAIALAMDKRK